MNPLNPAANTRAFDPERLGSLLVVTGAATALLLFFLWWKCHTQIVIAVLAIQNIELDLIGLFSHQYDRLHEEVRRANPAEVSAPALWTLCTVTGQVLRWPVLAVILGLAGICLTRAPRELYRRRFGLDGMQATLARMYPSGSAWPGTALPLVDPAAPSEPLRPMDPALKREEWSTRYVVWKTEDDRKFSAAEALARQLGQRWSGLSVLTTAESCMFLALTLYTQRRKKEAQAVLDDLAKALAKGRRRHAPMQTMAVPAVFRRDLDRRLAAADLSAALEMASRHAWTRPALMTLLQEARLRCGVVNPGLFAVIQLLDRELWLVLAAVSYPMHGLPPYVMSTTACPEASAAIEHWIAECAGGKPISEPRIAATLHAMGDA